jgi:hypothetical protein
MFVSVSKDDLERPIIHGERIYHIHPARGTKNAYTSHSGC